MFCVTAIGNVLRHSRRQCFAAQERERAEAQRSMKAQAEMTENEQMVPLRFVNFVGRLLIEVLQYYWPSEAAYLCAVCVCKSANPPQCSGPCQHRLSSTLPSLF